MKRRHLPRNPPTRSDHAEAKTRQFAPLIPVELPKSANTSLIGIKDKDLMQNAKQCKTISHH